MEDYKNLREYFEEQIEPAIPRLQREYDYYFLKRKNKILRRMNWGLIGLMTIAVALRLFFPGILPSNIIGLSFFILFCYLIAKWFIVDAVIQSGKEAKVFSLQFKQKMVQPILQIFGDSLQFFPESRIDTDTLFKSGLFYPTGNLRIEGEDLVKGHYKGLEFRFSEMSLIHKRGGERNDQPIFQGLFLEATLPKNLKGGVFVLPQSAFAGMGELFKMKILPSSDMTFEERKAHNMKVAMTAMAGYRWDVEKAEEEIGLRLQEMEVANEVVNEKFKVFADKPSMVDTLLIDKGLKKYLFAYQEDEIAMKEVTDIPSFRVIDNNTMARLARTHFCVAVVNDKAYLAMPFMGKNLFDPDWSDDFLSYENVETMYDELNGVFNFLDGFVSAK